MVTKLRFKKSKSTQNKPKTNQINTTTEHEEIPEEPNHDQRANTSPKPQSHSASAYFEWGPSVNGYRFVATDHNKPLHYQQRHHLIGSDEHDGFSWSYMELPEFRSEKDQFHETGFIYDDYYEEWEMIKRESKKEVLFPLFKESDELNNHNIELFLQSSTGDYNQVLKIERIRWHPDKMTRVTSNEELVQKITTTFQIINELWENRTKN